MLSCRPQVLGGGTGLASSHVSLDILTGLLTGGLAERQFPPFTAEGPKTHRI